jgi:hypothetical protein
MLAIGSEHSTPEFEAILDQRVQDQTIHLNEKYKRFTADYEELCRVVMEIRSRMSGLCALPSWPHGPGTTSLTPWSRQQPAWPHDPGDNQPGPTIPTTTSLLLLLWHCLCFRFIVYQRTNV